MSSNQRGLDAFIGRVLREFQIAHPSTVTPATTKFIREKFMTNHSVSATVRDLRAELHAQMIAEAAKREESLV